MATPAREFDRRRFSQLVEEKCNDALSEEGAHELEALVLASADARCEYWKAIGTHADLERELSSREEWSAVAERFLQGASLDDTGRRAGSSRRRRVYFSMAVASCIALGAYFAFWGAWHEDVVARSKQQQEGASVTTTAAPVLGHLKSLRANSRWSFGRARGWNSSDFHQGDVISLEEGEVELRLLSETVAVLRAPVVMQVVASDRVRVLRGRITVDVANGDKGFTVETASAEVVDLGTVFSVGVVGSGTDVIVFDGEVDLTYGGRHGAERATSRGATKRFQAGEAVHVDQDGTLSRIVNVNQAVHSSPATQPGTRSLISAVRDNISRDDMWSFYEIVPNGMWEDAKAYVDRPHEWNGITTGIPSYLLGADYVKTFCDDKITSDLVLELELQQPAIVYVFMDDRLTVPRWLVERFEDTGDDIGIDESYLGGGREAEVGPVRGVDTTFSIWRLISEQGGVVPLGPNGVTTPEEISLGVTRAHAAMYGIAAVRLDEVD